MLIIPSKQLLLITGQQSKQIFLFDPKTTAVITKYHSDPAVAKTVSYYPQANQFLTSFTNKTFINIWSTDCQQPINKVSTADMATYLLVSKDKNILYAGTKNGNIYIWQLPSGILLKKQSIHSSEVKNIIQYKPGYLMTSSKQQLKIWNLSSFYLETQRSTPIKTISSVLQIIDVEYIRNIFIVLTSKSVTYYLGGNQTNPFSQINKQDVQFPTKVCTSLSHVYIGDCQGSIHVNEIHSTQNSYDLDFNYNQNEQELQMNKINKKIVLKSSNKHPIICIVHLKSLPYLISGNTQGDIFIWQSHSLKKTVKLFKTSIKFIYNIPRPIEQKIHQSLKLQTLAKYQMGKQLQPLQIDISTLSKQNQFKSSFDFVKQTQEIVDDASNQLILENILKVLNCPDQILKSKIEQLQQQKQSLFKANLHYCQMLNQQDITDNNC